jgi:hypothetical protein
MPNGRAKKARPGEDRRPMTPLEIARVQAYLRKLFSNNLIRIVPPGRAGGAVEFAIGDEVLGTVYKDTDDNEVSYSVTLTILDEDLPDVQAAAAPPPRRR